MPRPPPAPVMTATRPSNRISLTGSPPRSAVDGNGRTDGGGRHHSRRTARGGKAARAGLRRRAVGGSLGARERRDGPRAAEPSAGGQRRAAGPGFASTLARHGLAPLRRAASDDAPGERRQALRPRLPPLPRRGGPEAQRERWTRARRRACSSCSRASPQLATLDLTGGAPELCAQFRPLVAGARALGREVIDRCNLTVLLSRARTTPRSSWRAHGVRVVASLPCYTRGERRRSSAGAASSRAASRRCGGSNALGYGAAGLAARARPRLQPARRVLPPDAGDARGALPRGAARAASASSSTGSSRSPTCRSSASPTRSRATGARGRVHGAARRTTSIRRRVPELMCRHLVSVGWDGELYDCDFNQMLELPLGGRRAQRLGGRRASRRSRASRSRRARTASAAPPAPARAAAARSREAARSIALARARARSRCVCVGRAAGRALRRPSRRGWRGSGLRARSSSSSRYARGGRRLRARLAADARRRRDLRRRRAARSTSSSRRRSARRSPSWSRATSRAASIEKRLAGNPRFAAIDRAIGAEGRKIVFLLRLSPAFPFSLLNYALGLTRVRFADYADRVGRHAAGHAALRVLGQARRRRRGARGRRRGREGRRLLRAARRRTRSRRSPSRCS